MRRLIVSILMSLVCAVPAAAQVAEQLTKQVAVQDQVMAAPKADDQKAGDESTQSIEETLMRQLATAGLTDIEMAPVSFMVRAKNADGKPVLLLLYPDSNLEWQVTPVDEDDPSTSSPNQERR
jgi:hypothetical protein